MRLKQRAVLKVARFLDNFEALKPGNARWHFGTFGHVKYGEAVAADYSNVWIGGIGAAALAGIAGLKAGFIDSNHGLAHVAPLWQVRPIGPAGSETFEAQARRVLGMTGRQFRAAFMGDEPPLSDKGERDVSAAEVAQVLRDMIAQARRRRGGQDRSRAGRGPPARRCP